MFRAAMTVSIVVGLLFVTAGCEAQSIGASAEQSAVRDYLKENLPTGRLEEIKWWKTKNFKGEKSSIRLKFRTQNPLGGMTVFDDAFYLKNGKVYEWHQQGGQQFHGD